MKVKTPAVYGHVCSTCGGRTYVCSVQGSAHRASLRVRVRHARDCALWLYWQTLYPKLFAMRQPEETING